MRLNIAALAPNPRARVSTTVTVRAFRGSGHGRRLSAHAAKTQTFSIMQVPPFMTGSRKCSWLFREIQLAFVSGVLAFIT
jgi:hypothetical protein